MAARFPLPSWTLIRRTLIVLVILGLVSAIALWVWVASLARDLPDYRQLAEYEPAITTRVHAGDGALIAEFANEDRVFVPYTSIPVHLVDAFTSAEDKKFFEHDGLDYQGIVRAALRSGWNKVRGQGGLQGGSTITQQVAKNFLLTRDQTIVRKVKEAIISRRIERAFSKEDIMELYLNEIYLGYNSYGVGSAALNYFGKSLPELNLSEAATLAALAQRPGTVNPYTNPERLVVRRNWVLGRMVANGHVTNDVADAAKAQPLETIRRLRGPEIEAAAYFVEELRRDLIAEYGEDQIYQGGLSIRSTIDTRLQLAAQEALQAGLEAYDRRHEYRGPFARLEDGEDPIAGLDGLTLPGGYGTWEAGAVSAVAEDGATIVLKDGAETAIAAEDVSWAAETYERTEGGSGLRPGDIVLVEVSRAEPAEAEAADSEDGVLGAPQGESILRQVPEADGALVALDPHSGRILAMAGGYSFWKSQFNRATQAVRQPGSGFKPFVYAAALEQGYTPVTKVLDAPFVDFDIEKDDFWAPSNYSEGRFYGLSTMRTGLEQSRNLMTVRLAQDIGMESIVDFSERVGLYDKLNPFLAMSLGAGELQILRMTLGYASLVNGGKRVTPTLFDRVQDRDGLTLFRGDDRVCEGCVAEAWDGGPPPDLPDTRQQTLDPVIAYQVVHMLEGVVQRGTGRRALRVGKPLAGKTGTSNDYFDAWFMGFSPDLVVGVWVGFDTPRTLGEGESGGAVAAPIFTDFMEAALKDTPPLPFRIPPGVRLVEIDAETGELPTPASTDLILEAFRPGTEPGVRLAEDDGALSIFGTGDTGLFGPRLDPEAQSDDLLDPTAPLPAEEVVVDDDIADGEY